ncbi:reticulon-1-like isoform X5 [Periophthalmus magnuspinnatus]|uniref:reticulon-1-like isoform X5 n=1 Tax=Periophthalmus magnuspinnatus TaxID=409849 RepID=UPI0024369D70|nr:reticulon-1-like isoform X5 [Periophthalmus magnuspinnatus]
MADSEEQQVTSTTSLLNDVVHHYEPEPELELEQPKTDHFSVDDIVDLVGGARDALERHIAEDSAPHELTETLEEHPVTLEEPAPVKEPEPEIIVPEPAPIVETTISEPEPEPVVVPEPEPVVVPEPEPVVVPEPEPVVVPEPEPVVVPEPVPAVEAALPDSTTPSIVPEVPPVVEEPVVVAPKAQPEITTFVPEPAPEPEPQPEPEPAPAPAPVPVSDALPVAEPHKEAPAPVEAADQPAVTEEPPAPASCLLQRWKLNLDSRVVDLLYWRDVKSTGAVFGAILLLLLSLTMCSIVSVCSYIGLALLSVTICFRIYKGILQAIQKSDEGHPFKQYLDQEVALSEDMVHKYSDLALNKINKSIADLRRLFLVEDLVDSIKFAVLMWILTYVGALFNGLTLVILAVVAAFSCPIIYEKHQGQIDHYLALVNNQIKDIVGKIQAKVPGMKRKSE